MKKQRGVFEKVPDSGVFWIQYFDAAGRRRREKVGPKSLAIKLAEKRRTDARAGVKMPENLRAKAATFAKLAQRTLAYSKANKRSYSFDVLRMPALIAAFGNRAAEDITRGDIQKWLDSKAGEWSQATRNRYLALMKLTYRLAEEDGVIKLNPARLVRQKKEDNGRVRYLLNKEEPILRAVLERSYSDHLPEFELALMTGMRMSDQFNTDADHPGLCWERIDLDAGTANLVLTKNGESRFVRLNSRALAVLRMLHGRGLGTGRVFPIMKPRWFGDAVREAGLKDFTWHCLRHTFASRLVMAGVDIRTVQELMGHKSITMTMRYAHLSPEHSAAALEKLCAPSATTTATAGQVAASAVAPVVN